jgi:glycosyltransferase involved in cell wall biosynthesis
LKILIIHTNYLLHGGEDTIVQQEIELLKNKYLVDTLFFQNNKGIIGGLQFLTSIWNVKAARIVKKKLQTFKPDIVHLHNWHFASGPLIIRAIKKMNTPIVYTLHNYRLLCPSSVLLHKNKLFTESIKNDFPWSAVFKKVYRNSFFQTLWLAIITWFHKKIKTWEMVDKYICLAPFSVDLFCESKLYLLKEAFVVKPSFTVKPSDYNLIIKKEDYFLFVGRLSVEKGIYDLINAFKELPYCLKIVGDGPLKEIVLQSQLEYSNIVYLGALSPTNVDKEMQKATALIFPSICLETFGLTIIEAFSNQCSVITSDIGAPPTIVTDGKDGFHYKHGNVSNLQAVIFKWMSFSVQEKQRMRKEAFKTYKSKYTPQKQYDYFETIYNNVLDFK